MLPLKECPTIRCSFGPFIVTKNAFSIMTSCIPEKTGRNPRTLRASAGFPATLSTPTRGK